MRLLANLIMALLPLSASAASSSTVRPVDELYDRARAAYNSESSTEALKAIALFERLAREFPREMVKPREGYLEKPFLVGPAALSKISRLKAALADIPGALAALEELDTRFHLDEFYGDRSGEGEYGGKGGAESLSSQVAIYSGSSKDVAHYLGWTVYAPEPDKYRDCKKAVEVGTRLTKEFGEEDVYCWEDCPVYGEIAAHYLLKCTDEMSPEIWTQTVDLFLTQPYSNSFKGHWPSVIESRLKKIDKPKERIDFARKLAAKYGNRVDTVASDDGETSFVVSYALDALKIGLGEAERSGNLMEAEILRKEFRVRHQQVLASVREDLKGKFLERYGAGN